MAKYKAMLQQVESCEVSLDQLQEEVTFYREKIRIEFQLLHLCPIPWTMTLNLCVKMLHARNTNIILNQDDVFQVELSHQRLPQIQTLVQNITARLQPYQYLNDQGLYSALSLQKLTEELVQLESDTTALHSQLNNHQTRKLSSEVSDSDTTVTRTRTLREYCTLLL